ncbi:MAG: glucoamylase family protein [Candidatus Izemoplasmatales bacterium]
MNSLEKELRKSIEFFLYETNLNLDSKGYGLIRDNSKRRDMASIASVGFGLSAYVIAVKLGMISYEEGLERTKGTFKTFVNLNHFNGFYIHFLDMETAQQYRKSEYSTIDTVIFMNGAITCDAFFDDAEVHQLFSTLFERLDFRPFVKEMNGKKVFRMAYNPSDGGDYRQHSSDPWIYQWHMYAEQLSMYFIAAATDTMDEDLAKELYLGFERNTGVYKNYSYIYSPTNALFIYQYSHAWIDFRHIIGPDNIDWFENSRIASLANREYCIDIHNEYPILHEKAWGLTACLTPLGYRNQCVKPNDLIPTDIHQYGVLPPSGAIGSVVFTPKESSEVLEYMDKHYPLAFKEYGFTDGIALLEDGSTWISDDYIGINKGITVLMIDNYLHQTSWDLYMSHPLIKKAMKKLSFERRT